MLRAPLLSVMVLVLALSTPWPPQVQAGGTAADVLGPDGRTWFPDWTSAGVQGGMPDVPVFGTIERVRRPRQATTRTTARPSRPPATPPERPAAGPSCSDRAPTTSTRRCSSASSGVVIRGAGRDKTKVVVRYNGSSRRKTDAVILFAGGRDGEPRPLAADGRRGDTRLSLQDATGLRPGDWLMVQARGTPRWSALIQSSSRLNPRMAIVRITAVEGNSVTINQPLRIDFPVEDESSVSTMALIERCGIEDLYLTQPERDPHISTVLFLRAANCWGRRVTVEWTGRMPLYGIRVKWMEIRDCEFNYAHDLGGGGTAYVGWDTGSTA